MGNCHSCKCCGFNDEILIDSEYLYFFQKGSLWHNRKDEILAY